MYRSSVLIASALLGLMGCGAAIPPLESGTPLQPTRAVEMFLDAASQRDHASMAGLFGTADGPLGDRGGTLGCAFRKMGSWIGLGEQCLADWEVELRMDVIASILKHESYRVQGGEAVAGRGRPAIRVGVEMDLGGRGVVEVPFVVIRSGNGRWLVEEVDLRRLVSRVR